MTRKEFPNQASLLCHFRLKHRMKELSCYMCAATCTQANLCITLDISQQTATSFANRDAYGHLLFGPGGTDPANDKICEECTKTMRTKIRAELKKKYSSGNGFVQVGKSENTAMFITHGPYTPSATVSDLQHYQGQHTHCNETPAR
ncbi:hypothetical protein WAI453_005895 [Rhynchosporium graminicola]